MAASASAFEERIARAKEAARLASLAASARSVQQPLHAPPPPPAAFHAFPSRGLAPAPPARHGTSSHFHVSPPPTAFAAASAPPPLDSAIPDDVKHRIDRLVEFIQRNGPAFEETVRQRERENPSFAFLQPTARFHDYFVRKKREACGGASAHVLTASAAPAPASVRASAPHAPLAATTVTPDALLSAMSVGAMASVCKLARKNGLTPYAPLPPELLWNPAALPSVEPGRLEIRLAEFYRETPMFK